MMLKPDAGSLKGIFLWAAALTGAGAAAPEGNVPPALMSAAECMARVVSGMPGVTDVEISVAPGAGRSYPVLAYSFSDASGRRRFTELSLFQIEGADTPYVFDRADVQEDLVAGRLLPVWKAQCRASLGYITSVPR